MRLTSVTTFIIAAALSSALAFAQLSGSGTITGTVTDPSGAAVPAAAITIHNVDTGIDRKIESNDAGVYTAAFLAPGRYEVGVSKAGFTGVLRKDLVLQVGQTMALDLPLTVKAAADTVTVIGDADVVNTEKTEVSQVVSQ